MRKDEIFNLVIDSWLELAERTVSTDKTTTDEQKQKQLDLYRNTVKLYKDMYFEEEETYESRRNDLRKKR
jgi:hypothetical protein